MLQERHLEQPERVVSGSFGLRLPSLLTARVKAAWLGRCGARDLSCCLYLQVHTKNYCHKTTRRISSHSARGSAPDVLGYRSGRDAPSPRHLTKMITTSTVFFLILITLPIVFILWLTESQPQKIKRLYKSGRFTQQQLADRFGVSRTTIRRRLAAA